MKLVYTVTIKKRTFTYLRRHNGMNFKAAHRMNTKPLKLDPRVLSYTLLNSMTPRNWEKTLMKP